MALDRAQWMDAGCRMALAAFLHDLGKLAERAGVFARDPAIESNRQLYCPYHRGKDGGWFTHLHAAATALAFDHLEPWLPDLVAGDPRPFAPRGGEGGDCDPTDSLINAAAAHHKPDTFLQWCVATGDRLASGFKREQFADYNGKRDRDHHVRTRLLVAFEAYGKAKAAQEDDLRWRYPLASLSPRALFPVRDAEPDVKMAQANYVRLWDALLAGAKQIPVSHRACWPLFVDHLDSLWLSVAHAIPSATAFDVCPDVSLYDHAKTTAALAVAMWRYHAERGDDAAAVARRLKDRDDYDDKKFLLIQGDFCGIQDFIFGAASLTQKGAARLLRGRSAMVALLTELAALRVLDDLALPATAQIINAAGKFLIVAPNTPDVKAALAMVRQRLDDWFLKHSFGLASIALAATEACGRDFLTKGEARGFKGLLDRLGEALDDAKSRRFGLCGQTAPAAIRDTDFANGVCHLDGRLPATVEDPESGGTRWAHPFSLDQRTLGRLLADRDYSRLLVFDAAAGGLRDNTGLLRSDIFGYRMLLTRDEEASGSFGEFARAGTLRRAFDLSLPLDGDAPLWHGIARRPINAHVPVFRDGAEDDRRYDGLKETAKTGDIKTFEHLARDDQEDRGDEGLYGVTALGVLKGDVDNLGLLFRTALGDNPTFAKWAALSRRMNAFFATWLPWRCHDDARYRNVYTVFAGGDDFFFVGPWRTLKDFAGTVRQDFAQYGAENPKLSFSAGFIMVKPGHPLRLLGDAAEEALAHAKARTGKNAIHLQGRTLEWREYDMLRERGTALATLVDEHALPTAYLHDVLALCDMAAKVKDRPQNARWRSLLFYRTRRYLRDVSGTDAALAAIIQEIGERGIGRMQAKYRIVVSDQLYTVRG
ncbi:MAG: type III-A CRISPR-associated protein Cas10/Csm1 [Azospirillaceae bacterium]|nr:type III-A CRISPR-associated protein Cas10/Csm1 [Azospirillaceae bacterium]